MHKTGCVSARAGGEGDPAGSNFLRSKSAVPVLPGCAQSHAWLLWWRGRKRGEEGRGWETSTKELVGQAW